METMVDRVGVFEKSADRGVLAIGPVDGKSLVGALAGAAGFFTLAVLCMSLSRFDAALASVWVPNASAVAFLLLARLRNELPFYVAVAIASFSANVVSANAVEASSIYTVANLLEIALVTTLMRRACGSSPDMTDLTDLTRFLRYGGLVGPAASASIAAISMWPDPQAIWNGSSSWFLADSMGMILTVPAALLTADALRRKRWPSPIELGERILLIVGGLIGVYFVFEQDVYPLLFLAPPITLIVAFRLGGLGTAIFVPGIAVVASAMTYEGLGPIVNNNTSDISKMFLIQSFVAANFLSGLPIAAILAGRERMLGELDTGKRQLDLLANNITDAVLRYDLEAKCTYASPSVGEVLNQPPDSFIGNKPSDKLHEDARERVTLAQQRLVAGDSDKERFTYRRYVDAEDGSPVFIEADCAIVYNPETNEREGFVVSARDVTERVELELLLTRARRHAENAARAKSEFLANMSHEIRTPMNGVLGFAELLLQSDLDGDQRRQAQMIVQSGRSMMLLLNDILDLSKIEAGQIAIDPAPCNLHETLAECASLHRANAEKKGLELRFEREGGKGARDEGSADETGWIMTDGLRLRQIVLNLIGNAVKFTESGLIHISYRVDEDQFTVKVTDTGIGISNTRIDTIFQPFTQAEGDTARRFGGTGLGLTISRQLAELLGGFLEVESEPGIGSCFMLTLPATPADPEEAPQPSTAPLSLTDLPHDARILLAEDHDINRILASEMLERCGQSVAIAHDGNEAISMVIDSVMRGSPFDLVLMDIQMPGCDGYAATRAIRAEGITPDTLPIIALTANAFPEDIAAARDAGMQAHLSKPLVFADLARALQRWLPTRIVEEETKRGIAHEGRDEGDREGKDQGGTADDAAAVPQITSPELVKRWLERRSEAVEAVREAAEDGALGNGSINDDGRSELARIVHKLAGTAAMFGEPELGDQAAAFERALRNDVAKDVQQALASELLNLADQHQALLPAASNA